MGHDTTLSNTVGYIEGFTDTRSPTNHELLIGIPKDKQADNSRQPPIEKLIKQNPQIEVVKSLGCIQVTHVNRTGLIIILINYLLKGISI